MLTPECGDQPVSPKCVIPGMHRAHVCPKGGPEGPARLLPSLRSPHDTPLGPEGRRGSRPYPTPLAEEQDHQEEAKAPHVPDAAHEASPGPSSLASTHLDALPGEFWVLLLKLRDELVVVYLQQTQGSLHSAWGLLWAGTREAWPALPSRRADTRWGPRKVPTASPAPPLPVQSRAGNGV